MRCERSIGGAGVRPWVCRRSAGVALRAVGLCMVIGGAGSGGWAQPVRGNRVVCAVDAPICARADAARNETVVERAIARTRTSEALWTVPRWLNVVRIDEAGENLLAEAQPTLEVATGLDAATPLLALYRQGRLFREFTVADLFSSRPEQEALRRAPAWAQRLPAPDSDVARYLLASGRVLRLPLATGVPAYE